MRPGPASTVGDRPPTNPAIRVRFPPQKQMDVSFSPVAEKCEMQIHSNYSSGKNTIIGQRHLLDILESGLSVSHCMKGNVALKIGPMTER